MTPAKLLSKLTHLWLIIEKEDTEISTVTMRNMYEPAKAYFENENNTVDNLWEHLCGLAKSFPIYEQQETSDIYRTMDAFDKKAIKEAQLNVPSFIHAFSAPEDSLFTADSSLFTKDCYINIAKSVALSLGISTDEEDTNNDFWPLAYDDNLTPLAAVLDSQKVHAHDAHQHILEHMYELPDDETEKVLSEIFSNKVDPNSDYSLAVTECLGEWDNDYLEEFYNRILNKNIVIID